MAFIELISLRCNDAQEGTDEPYLRVNGRRVWGPASMVTGNTQAIRQDIEVDGDVTVQLRECDRRGREDTFGTFTLSQREVDQMLRGDHGGDFSYVFRRDKGITGDASYTLTYNVKETCAG